MARYEYINGTLAGDNLAYFFVYANQVTHQLFGLFSVIFFFLVVLIGSMFAQLRTTGRLRPETSFFAASFVTSVFCFILMQYDGILKVEYMFVSIVLTIVGAIWVSLSSGE